MPITTDSVLSALLPDPRVTHFPVPNLSQSISLSSGALCIESFTLASIQMPGQWILIDCPREFGWDIRMGYGMTGATVVPIGDPLASPEFLVNIWNDSDAAIYRSLLKTILKKPVGLIPGSTTAAGMGIDQPQLKDIGVTSVVVKRVSPLINPLVTSGGRGPWTAKVQFLEYRAPIPALPKPSQSIPDKAPPTPSASDLIDVETQRLTKGFTSAAGGLVQALLPGPKP